jgi:hypothetical protein
MFVLTATLMVINATFKFAILAVDGSNFLGVCQTIGMGLLQIMIQYQVLTRSVAMIHRVPHMVATLMKAEVSDLAQQDEGRQLTIAAAGSFRGGASKVVAGAVPKSPSGRKGKTDPATPSTDPDTSKDAKKG